MRGIQKTQASSLQMGLVSVTRVLSEMSNETKNGNEILDVIKNNFDNITESIGESLSKFTTVFFQSPKNKLLLTINSIDARLDVLSSIIGSINSKPFEPNITLPAIQNSFEPNITLPAIQNSFEPNITLPSIQNSFEPNIILPAIQNSFEPTIQNDVVLDPNDIGFDKFFEIFEQQQNKESESQLTQITEINHIQPEAIVDKKAEKNRITFLSVINSINDKLRALDQLGDYDNGGSDGSIPTNNDISKYLQNPNLIFNSLLTSINSKLIDLYDLLNHKDKPDSKIPDKNKPEEKSDKKPDEAKSGFNIAEYVENIVSLNKNLTKGLIRNFDQFLVIIEKYGNIDSDKIDKVNKSFSGIATNIKTFGESTTKLGLGLLAIAGAGLILSFALTSPGFILASATLVGMVFGLQKAMNTSKSDNKGFIYLASGILILSGALVIMSKVPFVSILKLIMFIGMLAVVVNKFNMKGSSSMSAGLGGFKSSSSGGASGLISLAVGVSILTLALFAFDEVPITSILKMITFIGLLGITLKLFNTGKMTGGLSSPILSFAVGIGILTLSLFAMEAISFGSITKLLIFVAGLGLVLKFFNESKMSGTSVGKSTTLSPLTSFAFGIGILVLSLFAMEEVSWTAMFKLLIFVGLLGLTIKVFNGNSPQKGLPGFAFGLGLMVLAMFAMNELPWSAMFKTLGFLFGLGLVMKLFNKSAGVSMLMMSGALLIMAGALYIVGKSPITVEKAIIFGSSILFIAGIMIAMGIPVVAGLAITGSITMIAVSLAGLVIAGTLGIMSVIPINFEAIIKMITVAGILAVGFTLIAPFAAIGAIGAVLMLPIAISSVLLAGSLSLIQNVNFDNVGSFTDSLVKLSMGFAMLTPLAIIGAVGAIAMTPIALASLAFAGVLAAISTLEISSSKIENYNTGVTSVIKGINEFGIVQLAKAGAKSLLMLPIYTSALAGALVLESISSLEIKEGKIDGFSLIIGKFVNSMVTAVKYNVDNLKLIEPGLDALTKLINVGAGLVDVVMAFANMNYNVYSVKDGKLQLVGTKKITDADIAQVGVNVGKLIQGLLVPLAILSSDEDTWNFGNGVVVKNPFKGGWFGTDNNSGADRISKIGGAFLPLADAVTKFSNMGMMNDPKLMDNFNKGIISVVSTLITVFDKLGTSTNDEGEKTIQNLTDFVDGFDKLEDKNFKSITDIMTNFVNTLSDDAKWNKINKNLVSIKDNFKDISKNINSIDLEKAMVLERNLKLMSEKESSENLKEVIENLKELIGLMIEKQTPVSSGSTTTIIEKSGSTTEPTNKKDPKQEITGLMIEDIKTLISTLATKLDEVNVKLGGKLKVVPIGANSNSL